MAFRVVESLTRALSAEVLKADGIRFLAWIFFCWIVGSTCSLGSVVLDDFCLVLDDVLLQGMI